MKRTWCEIDYGTIAHNLDEVQKLVGNTKILGIAKADAYGHGAVACVKAMEDWGVDLFAVAALSEAVELREAGIDADILILGYTAPEDFSLLDKYNLIQTIVDKTHAEKMNDWAKAHNTKLRAHVKADTGMNRIGTPYKDNDKDFDAFVHIYNLPNLKVEGIFSHYPVSDDLGEEAVSFTNHQTELFLELIDRLEKAGINPGLRHIQNSYGILNYGDMGMDYCRPGLLYMGVTSDDEIPIASNPDFIPILSLKTVVSMVKTIKPGQTVSYGRHFKADTERQIASLSIGYADGLPRLCSNKNLEVLINGKRAPIVGNICMDQCMADVTGLDVKAGDIATIVGKDGDETVTIDQISRLANTINNETLTRLTRRVPRKALHG